MVNRCIYVYKQDEGISIKMQPTTRSGLLSDACCSLSQMHATFIKNIKMLFGNRNISLLCFRSLALIQGPEGYGPSTLPLRHSELEFLVI